MAQNGEEANDLCGKQKSINRNPLMLKDLKMVGMMRFELTTF